MKKRKFHLKNEDGEHEYTVVAKITDDCTTYTLKRSKNILIWSEKALGEKLFTLIDTGNNIIFEPKIKKDVMFYSYFGDLFILIKAISEIDTNMFVKYSMDEMFKKIKE